MKGFLHNIYIYLLSIDKGWLSSIKCSTLIVLMLQKHNHIFDRIMDLIIPDNWGVYYSYTTIFFFRNKGNINSKHAIMIIHWVVCSSSLNNSLKHCIQTYLCVTIIGFAGKSLGIQKWYQVYPYHSIKFRQLYVMWWFVSLICAQFLWHDEYAWKTFELLKKRWLGLAHTVIGQSS